MKSSQWVQKRGGGGVRGKEGDLKGGAKNGVRCWPEDC